MPIHTHWALSSQNTNEVSLVLSTYLKSELYQDIEKSISISASVFVLWWSELQATESQQDY